MALILSAASGNFNSGATWVGGIVPGVGDEARAATGHVVTITADATCTEISNAGTGYFVLNGGVTLTANVTQKTTTASRILLYTAITSPESSTIIGQVRNGVSTFGVNALQHGTNGTLNIQGNVSYVQPNDQTRIITNISTGIINITGNVSLSNIINHGDVLGILNSSSGTINVTGNVTGGGSAGNDSYAIRSTNGTIQVTGNVFGGATSHAINTSGACIVTITGDITAGVGRGLNHGSTGQLTLIGLFSATNNANAVVSTGTLNRISGSFISSSNGNLAVNTSRFILLSTPLNAKTRYALDGSTTYVDMFTADNSTALNQAAPTDVRSGVAYGISNSQTGRLTVPARGSVALSVNYGPSMPFTATRSGTTATATLAYSYPLVVGDQITVTGSSNAEWNGSYTIASVVSGTAVTFIVPATHSAAAGTGATMQTTGTAVLDPGAVASAVWGAATRTITGGTVDTLTNAPASVTPADIWSHASRTITGGTVDTLTNAPTVPSAAAIASQVRSELSVELGRVDQNISSRLAASDYTAPSVTAIRQEMDSNSTKLANLDATVSSRLAGSSYTAPTTPPTAAEIATAVEGSLLNEADGQAVLNAIVGAIGNQNLSEVSLVAAVRADLERAGGKLDNIPTTSAPSASTVAGAVRTELGTELSRIDQSISSRLAASAYTAPANSDITAIKAKTDNLPASPAATGDIPSANITAIKAKTDLLNTERLANVPTVNILGTLLAQANS